MKIAIICSHPIQYYTPVFSTLAKEINLHVFYTLGQDNTYDIGFQQKVIWDIPLLEGYPYSFVNNTSKDKGTHHFNGIVNPSLNEEIAHFNPDAILVYGWANSSHLRLLRHFKGKKKIYFRGDSTLLGKNSFLKTLLRKLFLTWVYGHIDFALYVGRNNHSYFKSFGVKDHQLKYVPHSIDNSRFEKFKYDSKFRQQFGISDSQTLILFAGKFTDIKNPLLLLNAFQQIDSSNLGLLFVGDGSKKEELVQKASNFNNIYFLPFLNQAQIPEAYASCDLFCMPSKSETWGLAINEAMACSKAILASDRVGCAVDLIQSKINGDIFESENIEDLKLKLTSLTSSRQELLKMGKNSYKIIQNFSIQKQVEYILKALK